MRDRRHAVQVKTNAAVLLHWSGVAEPTCSAGKNHCSWAAPLVCGV
jgi:hypothetical protein